MQVGEFKMFSFHAGFFKGNSLIYIENRFNSLKFSSDPSFYGFDLLHCFWI